MKTVSTDDPFLADFKKPLLNRGFELNAEDWSYFNYSDIFDIERGKSNEDNTSKNKVLLIGASQNLNGSKGEYKKAKPKYEGNLISIGNGGNTGCGQTFYQPYPFNAKSTVNIINLKNKCLNKYIALFLVTVIKLEKFRFDFGRGWSKGRMLKHKIKLPAKNNQPDWDFMENYIKSLATKKPNKEPLLSRSFELDTGTWKAFGYCDLFKIKGSKTTPIIKLKRYGNGKYPYVTTQATNNGVDGFYDFYTEFGECFTVDSAVLGYCSYQKNNFSASDHVEKLIPKFEVNKYIAIFLTTILNLEQHRYSYGRKCSQTRMKETSIKLPAKNNQPDWDFMENYIKSLEYSKSL